MAVKYKCPTCGWAIEMEAGSSKLDNSRAKDRFNRTFPAHADCELAKPASRIDTTKLEELE